ncbi:MAG: mechanosensitive ion channel [Flavobacterium sp.]|nr:mechanosensitive ion channel [Pedobacter sp.]
MNYSILNQIFLGNSVKSYLLFAGILIFGLLFKRIFSKLFSKLLFKVFGRFVNSENPQLFITLLIRPIEILLMLVIVYMAINQLSFPLNESVFTRETLVNNTKILYQVTVIRVVDKVFILLFIISGFWVLLRIIDFIAIVFIYRASLTVSKSDDQMVPFIKELTKIIAIIFAVFVTMGSVFNMNVATIIAGLGIGGIAIALAAQDTLQNLLGSFTIFADKPFVVGDTIRFDKYEGTIEKVGFRSTLLRTLDKTLVIIPNKKLVDTPLENLSLQNLRRMKFNVALKYNTKTTTMLKISKEIEEYVNKHEATSNDALATFDSFGDSALNLQVLYFIEILDYNKYMRIRQEVNYGIMEIVTRNGGEFAFPSQTVYHQYPVGKEL